MLLRRVLVANFILTLFHPIYSQGRKLYLHDFTEGKKRLSHCLASKHYRPISFKLVLIIENTIFFFFFEKGGGVGGGGGRIPV